jgi:radical SAM superfamily enzyme YgiQ (UPF0313 family)
MKTVLSLAPSYNDRQPMPHLGLACLSAFLAQCGIQADILDLNIESHENWYDPLTLTVDKLYVDELLDLPLAALVVQGFRRGNLAKQLLAEKAQREFFLKYALDFGLSAENLLAKIHSFNLLALTFSRKFQPYDVVCFTLYRSNFYSTVLLTLLLREQNPQVKIVIGGPQVSQSELSCRFLLQFGIADAIIRGEGEETLGEFLEAVIRNKDYRLIPGVMTYEPPQTFAYIPREQRGGLDHLPTPDFSKFKPSKYSPFCLPAYASRGCPYSCSYCSQKPLGRMRYRSVKKAVDDLKLLQHRHRTRFFRFADNLMNPNHVRVEELAERLISQKPGIIWQAYFCADITDAIARKLKQAGLEFATIGVESLSAQVLKQMNKHCSQTDNLQAIDSFLSAGISVKLNLIVGHPGESAESYLETLQQAKRLVKGYASRDGSPALNISVYPFHVSPGSPAYHRPADFGIMLHHGNSSLEQEFDDDLAGFMSRVPVSFSAAGLNSGEVFRRFQALNNLAAGSNDLLCSASLKNIIRDSLQPDDHLLLSAKLRRQVTPGVSPVKLYLPVEKTDIQLSGFGQTIFNVLRSTRELAVENLQGQVAAAHPEVQQAEILDILAVLIHNRIIRLSPA